MKPPITRKRLVDWAGEQTVRDAESLVSRGLVLEAEYEPPLVRGAVQANNRRMETALKLLPDGTVENRCPCYANRERGLVCVHVIALGVTLMRRAADPRREEKYREELRRASRLAAIDEAEYITRADDSTPGAVHAELRITLDHGWAQGVRRDRIPVCCELAVRDRNVPLDRVPRDLPVRLNRRDESLLFVLEDISEGPARGRLELKPADFLNVVRLCAGASLGNRDGPEVTVNETAVSTFLRMELEDETGRLVLTPHTELPFMQPGEAPLYLVRGRSGWVYGAANLWPLEQLVPEPYHGLYREPVVVERPQVLAFLERELPLLTKHLRLESDLSPDLFAADPAAPEFRLLVRGSPASLAGTLYARYGEVELIAAAPDAQGRFAVPDPDDLLRYEVRNPAAERRALALLAETGMTGERGDQLADLVGRRDVLNFLGRHLPALRRRGWRVDLEGRVAPFMDDMDVTTPVVHVEDGTEGRWFEVGFDIEDGRGASLSSAEVQEAIRKGESFLRRGDRTILIDSQAIESMLDVFSDCASDEGGRAGRFRMDGIHAAYVKASLDALDGVDVEDTPAWRLRAEQANRTMTIEPVPLPGELDRVLRAYQKDGVYWLRFLERHGFCGILADEMGLGKTLQALAWLNLSRCDPEAAGQPSLIVCPTSIVENWAEEAARFAPKLRVLCLTGAERHQRWSELPAADLAVTSYALLRRDLDRYLETEFAAAVLDEAQHIKNRSTRNARAAKQLRARHRLVLTGTPVENSVSDLWSIMDFLMPGYLGGHRVFRDRYERPIARGEDDGETAQARLRRKLQPFLLRRLKRDVARDLPPKIERVAFCTLTPDQKLVYRELLEESRRKLSRLVARQGFQRARMQVLTTLMRLRQICCHLDLLKIPDLQPSEPSGKLDLFHELLNEALDSGHRILVFSQFVSMLHILRNALDEQGLAYCYLDGATKNRLEIVHRFNRRRDIPVFLISLKAGGTGLNLTGADMVVHFDPWWNPAVENQATDRAYRIGQRRTVYSVRLITRGTVEERVLALQKRKQAVIDATVESDQPMADSLTWEDVQDLLRP